MGHQSARPGFYMIFATTRSSNREAQLCRFLSYILASSIASVIPESSEHKNRQHLLSSPLPSVGFADPALECAKHVLAHQLSASQGIDGTQDPYMLNGVATQACSTEIQGGRTLFSKLCLRA